MVEIKCEAGSFSVIRQAYGSIEKGKAADGLAITTMRHSTLVLGKFDNGWNVISYD